MSKRNEPPETRRLREFYALGKRVLKVYHTSHPLAGGKRRRGVTQTFNRKLGLQRDQVDKARQFAATYSDEEVDALFKMGSGITKSHVIRLLAVRSKPKRRKLAKRVVDEQWTVQQLGAEITKLGKHSQGGRRPKRPATVTEALEQIQRMARQWLRWVEIMADRVDVGGIGIGDLPVSAARAVRKMNVAANQRKQRSKK